MKKLTYQIEDWFDCKEEMKPLIPRHWEEVAMYKDEIKLDFWWEKYDEMARAEQLYIITARDDNKIVGYYWARVMLHLHYKNSLTAYTDMFYLHPKYRKGFNGINLFKFYEESMKKLGVQRIISSCKASLDMSKIFERLKWDRAEIVYTKLIG